MKFFQAILLQLICIFLSAQNSAIDSLLSVLAKQKDDTNKAKTLFVLSMESMDDNEVLRYAQEELKLSEKLNYKEGIAEALNNIGYVYDTKGEIGKALENYEKSLEIRKEIKSTTGISTTLVNIGYIYSNQGDLKKALDYFYQSLKLAEERNEKHAMALALINIGATYKNLGDPVRALEFDEKSLKIQKEMNDKEGMAYSLNSMGWLYKMRGDTAKALNDFSQSLKLREEIGDKKGAAGTLNGFGSVYEGQKNYTKALEYYQKALALYETVSDKNGMASSMEHIGELFFLEKKYKEAERFCLQSLKIAQELGYPESIRNSSKELSEIYSAENNFKDAFSMHQLFKQMSDSIINDETKKLSLRKEMQYDFQKKEDLLKLENEKQIAVSEAENKKQKIVTWSVIGGLILVIVFSLVLLNRFRISQQQKKIIEEQKLLVDEKNKDITDSINYARRIQEAILPAKEIKYTIFPDAFVLYKPKDIVSGDFYWFAEKNGRRLIAAADCTGHGVPGGFMSMIGNTFLNAIVNEKGITQPDLILNELRQMIITSLKQSAQGNNKDGMDITVLSFDDRNFVAEFAGANNPLVHISGGTLSVIKGSKQPVGYYAGEIIPFALHKINYTAQDSFYIFSDGYADQFGGPQGKKLREKKLHELLLTIQDKPMPEQEKYLDDFIENWRGKAEQVDDILVIGIKV